MHPLSVTIIARDEEDHIAAAVDSVAWADEVLVVDAGSRDRTVELARSAGARVVVEGWRGFGAQKNLAAELAAHDWVLSLDADEVVTPQLAVAIRALPSPPPCAAYRMRRRNRFGERVIRRWPWSWDRVARVYDRRRARFSTPRVHESLVCDGAVGELAGVLEHDSSRDWDDHRRRQEAYARLGAEEAIAAGRSPRPGDLTVRPLATFLRHLLVRGYLIGGVLGWRLSLSAARGTRLKYACLRQLHDSLDQPGILQTR